LSIGIQSFNHNHLKFLHRTHTSEDAIRTYTDARQIGFKNISIDLIYGIPSENNRVWSDDLEMAISIQPEHISAYCLTIEPKTVFGVWLKKGKLQPVNETLAAEQFEMTMDVLASKDYIQYEISNFAKEGFRSNHNSNYWKHLPYLGVGPGAHSFDGHRRSFNVTNNNKYIKAISNGDLPSQYESLTNKDLANEYLMTSIRTSEGCNLTTLLEDYDYDIHKYSKSEIEKWSSEECIIQTGDILKLTRKGKLLADEITADLYWV
jgi:oxygen-independent coproporphyrinogen-3 oxidase